MAVRSPYPYDAEKPSLLHGLRVQHRVIAALMLRELHTRYGRENIGYAWLLLDPLVLAFAVALLHVASGGHAGTNIHPAALSMVGYIVFIMFRSIFTRSGTAIESNAPLLHHRHVKLNDVMFARATLDLIGTIAAYIVLIGIAIAFGWTSLPVRPEYVALAILAMFVFSMGAGMLLCAAAYERPLVERISHPFTYLVMPICGAFYMLQWFTPAVRHSLQWIPLVNLFEMLRYGQFEEASGEYFSMTYLAAWCVGLLMLGMLAMRATEPHIHVH